MGKKKSDKKFLDTENWQKFQKEYENSDDRTCALLCASYLDHCLELLLLESIPNIKELYGSLLSDMMPLGSFSAKIKIAYALNLIPKTFYSDLEAIRNIRNKCAHQLHGLKFEAEPLLSICNSLVFPNEYSEFMGLSIESTCGRDPRQLFVFTSVLMAGIFESYYLERAKNMNKMLQNLEPKFDE